MKEKMELSNSVGKVISILAVVVVIIVVVLAVIYVRNKIKVENVNEENEEYENYEILPDGTKVNNSAYVKNAEFIDKGIKLTGFRITEFNGVTTVNGVVENTTDEKITDITIKIGLYDNNDDTIYSYLLTIPEIEGKVSQTVQTNIKGTFANVAGIEATIKEGTI